MKYLLDFNIFIHFLRGKYNIIEKLNEVGIDDCAISEITLAELDYGAEKSANPKKKKARPSTKNERSILFTPNILYKLLHHQYQRHC